MIIYGWNSKIIKNAPIETVVCINCQEKSSLMEIHSHYFHLFWIPVFPFSKKATITCNHCKHVTEEKHMVADYKSKLKALKSTVPFPKFHFLGLGLILLLGLFFTFQNYRHTQLENEYLHNPEAGDVYVLKNNEEKSDFKYYLIKVEGLEADSVLFSTNSYTYNNIPVKLDPKDGFYNISYRATKSTFLELYSNGELKKVIREKDMADFSRTLEYTEEETAEPEVITSFEQ